MNKFYYLDGSILNKEDHSKQLHRVDGPAIEWADGDKSWYLNGEFHRIDGPAIEWADGYKAWYLNGEHITKLTKDILINYMKSNNYILAHLLTDPESIVREAAFKYGDKL